MVSIIISSRTTFLDFVSLDEVISFFYKDFSITALVDLTSQFQLILIVHKSIDSICQERQKLKRKMIA